MTIPIPARFFTGLLSFSFLVCITLLPFSVFYTVALACMLMVWIWGIQIARLGNLMSAIVVGVTSLFVCVFFSARYTFYHIVWLTAFTTTLYLIGEGWLKLCSVSQETRDLYAQEKESRSLWQNRFSILQERYSSEKVKIEKLEEEIDSLKQIVSLVTREEGKQAFRAKQAAEERMRLQKQLFETFAQSTIEISDDDRLFTKEEEQIRLHLLNDLRQEHFQLECLVNEYRKRQKDTSQERISTPLPTYKRGGKITVHDLAKNLSKTMKNN